jgi:excisionase family DNA binding protein
MSNLTSINLETTKKSLSYKLTNYFHQKWLYQTIIGDVKKHVKEEIASNLHKEEQERINSILDSAMKRIREEEQPDMPAVENAKPTDKKEKDNKDKLLQNAKGDYTVVGAAGYLGMGVSTVRKYQKDKKINGYKFGNKRFFTKEELDSIETKEKTEAEIEQEVEDAIIEGKTGAKK